MIFYRADDDGHTKVVGTQADAKAINRDFEQIDIPTDKTGLMAFVQKLYDDIYDLEHGQPGAPTPELKQLMQTPAPWEAPPPLPDDIELPDEDAEKLDARLLEEQVCSLGVLGVDALEQFDGWSALTGISPAFSRGVHLLNVLAADDHTIARVFLRDRLKRRKRFG